MIGKFFWGILTLPYYSVVWLLKSVYYVLKWTLYIIVAILLLFLGIDILTDGL